MAVSLAVDNNKKGPQLSDGYRLNWRGEVEAIPSEVSLKGLKKKDCKIEL
jgi:hypothetical protein